MDRDEILRQGRDLAHKLREGAGGQAAQHEQQIKDFIDKAIAFINDKTGGKYSEQVGKAAGFVEHGVHKLAEAAPPAEGSAKAGGPPTTVEPTVPDQATDVSPPSAEQPAPTSDTADEPAASPEEGKPPGTSQPPAG